MAGPIVLATSQLRIVEVTCPQCGRIKLVERTRRQAVPRTCPRCKQALPLAPPDVERT